MSHIFLRAFGFCPQRAQAKRALSSLVERSPSAAARDGLAFEVTVQSVQGKLFVNNEDLAS